MTRQVFEARKAAALKRLADDWEQWWRDKRFGKLRHGADFNNGAPGDLVIEIAERERLAGNNESSS